MGLKYENDKRGGTRVSDDFFAGYIISLFNKKTRVTSRQLSLIAGGKRTPSVLFTVEKNKLYTLFGLFPDSSKKDWEQVAAMLIEKRLLSLTDEKLSLTPEGLRFKESFIKKFPLYNELDQLRYASTKLLFWHRLIFTTQVLSEYSFKNKHYVPYLSSLDDQQSLKKWLAEQGRPMDTLAVEWFGELKGLFTSLPQKEADFIAGHMTGYNVSGSTSRQLRERYGLSKVHYIVLVDQLSYKAARGDKKDFPLLASLWESTHLDRDEGLSRSARLTKQLLEKGKGIEEIARMRKLKANTIKEHILECVLITDWPYFKRYIPAEHYRPCHAVFQTDPDVTYAEAKSEIQGLDFFTFRLIEIERTRHHE